MTATALLRRFGDSWRALLFSAALLIGAVWPSALSGCRAGAATTGTAPLAVAPAESPPQAAGQRSSAQGCRACNGIWAVHGIATVESCNCRTHDGGKRCRDGAECEGACVAAELPEREIVSAGPPAQGYFVGRCSDLMTVFGCNRFIERGAATAGPASLAEPPAMMCVD